MPGELKSDQFYHTILASLEPRAIPEREGRNNDGYLRMFIEIFELHYAPDAKDKVGIIRRRSHLIRLAQILQDETHTNALADTLQSAISKLTANEQKALELRFDLNIPGATETPTFKEIGEIMNVNKQRAQALVSRSLARLRIRSIVEPLYGFSIYRFADPIS